MKDKTKRFNSKVVITFSIIGFILLIGLISLVHSGDSTKSEMKAWFHDYGKESLIDMTNVLDEIGYVTTESEMVSHCEDVIDTFWTIKREIPPPKHSNHRWKRMIDNMIIAGNSCRDGALRGDLYKRMEAAEYADRARSDFYAMMDDFHEALPDEGIMEFTYGDTGW